MQVEMLDKDELISSLRIRIGELIMEELDRQTEIEELTAIYHAAEDMVSIIAIDGEHSFHTGSLEVCKLMGAMHDYDGGSRKQTPMPEE